MSRFNAFFKVGATLTSIIMAACFAGVYGILHNQVTYTISPEYFTKFKYIQFGVNPGNFGGNRPAVAVIGFLATWWVGVITGIAFGCTALVYPTYKTMLHIVLRALLLTFTIAICMGIAGFLYGKYYLMHAGVNWWLPENLADKNSFIIVGSIHNGSYIGGLVGMVAGIIYMLVKKRKVIHSSADL